MSYLWIIRFCSLFLLQFVTSFALIYKQKEKISYFTEIFLSVLSIVYGYWVIPILRKKTDLLIVKYIYNEYSFTNDKFVWYWIEYIVLKLVMGRKKKIIFKRYACSVTISFAYQVSPIVNKKLGIAILHKLRYNIDIKNQERKLYFMRKEKILKGFARKGQKLSGVMYKTENLIVHVAKVGKKGGAFVVLGSGYSLSVDEHNRIIEHDPLMVWPDMSCFSEDTRVVSIFYPFECKGLAVAGEELADYFNQYEFDSECIFIGHSKCGACFANMAKLVKDKSTFVTVSAAFYGTPVADLEFQMRLSGFARWLYCKIFSNHKVDQDICPGSEFLKTADYSGLKEHTHINITSFICNELTLNPITLFLRYLDEKGIRGDGIVPIKSQEIAFENSIRYRMAATHAQSLKIGIICLAIHEIETL